MKRRIWLTLVFLLLAGLSVGAYLEEGQSGPKTPLPRPWPTPYPSDVCGAREAVMEMIDGVRLADMQWRQGVALYPVMADPWRGDGSITSLDRAMRKGRLEVRERGGGSVPWLDVKNNLRKPVLLMAGEILKGGKQNRLVANDYLVPPRSGWTSVPVFCGEQHRWSGGSAGIFKSSKTMVPAAMRRDLAEGAAQDSIWRKAGEEISRFGASTKTQNIQKVYENSELGRALKCFHGGNWTHFPRRTVGMVVMGGGRVLGVEVYANEKLFHDNWRKVLDSLLAGYPPVLTACRRGNSYEKKIYGDYERQRALNALQDLANSRFVAGPDGGDGCCAHVRNPGGLSGQTLINNNALTHIGVISYVSLIK